MKLYLPKKINIGFQNRSDTYTGKLAYIIYWDDKGVLRKEKSWQSWRDNKIEPQSFNNEPTEGFVLNKKVGGYKSDWNFRQAYVRIFDPRGFEFEITVSNLLFILQECDCSKGKGLEGKFVYGWEGTELILLPVNSSIYKDSTTFTKLQTTTVKAKDLILGATYLDKSTKKLTYVGRFDWHQIPSTYGNKKNKLSVLPKQYVFHNGERFVNLDTPKTLSELVSSECAPNYSQLVEDYNKSFMGSKVVDLVLKDEPEPENTSYWYNLFVEKVGNTYIEYRLHINGYHHYGSRNDRFESTYSYRVDDGLKVDSVYSREYRQSLNSDKRMAVYAVLESGSEFKLVGGHFCG